MMGNKLFSDLLYSKQDKVDVSFKPDGLPIPFSKSASDTNMADYNDSIYQSNSKISADGSFEGPISEEAVIQGDIEGGRRKKNRRTRKSRRSRKPRKSRKSRKTRKH